jgi:hypothetical protein
VSRCLARIASDATRPAALLPQTICPPTAPLPPTCRPFSSPTDYEGTVLNRTDYEDYSYVTSSSDDYAADKDYSGDATPHYIFDETVRSGTLQPTWAAAVSWGTCVVRLGAGQLLSAGTTGLVGAEAYGMTFLALKSPAGAIVTDSSAYSQGGAVINFVAPAAGSYTIMMGERGAGAPRI